MRRTGKRDESCAGPAAPQAPRARRHVRGRRPVATGSLLADPDGLTVCVNGWDAASRPAGALKVVAARLAAGADGARAWATLWTTAPTPEGAAAGRYTFTGAQRRDGSLVFSGWQGAILVWVRGQLEG